MNCCFSTNHYKEILESLKENNYEIKRIMDYTGKEKKAIFLRHDVDFSLEMAYDMANIEYDSGIKSSYMIYLHSEMYNALSPKGMGMIRSIYDMGHEIGLHAEGTNFIQEENKILEYIFKGNVFNYTFHLPGLRQRLESFKYIRNAMKLPLKYISDSGRNWRELCLCKHINKDKLLHVLVHPEWWITNAGTREGSVAKLWMYQDSKTQREIEEVKQLLVNYVRDDLKQ